VARGQRGKVGAIPHAELRMLSAIRGPCPTSQRWSASWVVAVAAFAWLGDT
jgi:hypothetical protein